MLYYPITLNNLEYLRKDILELASTRISLTQQAFTYGLGVDFFLSCDSLKQELVRLDLLKHVHNIGISVVTNITFPIHTDSDIYTYSLNIPLSGYENTFISHYKPKDNASSKTITAKGGFIYTTYEKEDCDLIQKTETILPALVNTHVPHSFENQNSIPRILIMIRFKNETFNYQQFIDTLK